MGNSTFAEFFFSKGAKEIQLLAFSDKVKIVKSYVPEKVKLFIEKNLLDELKYFQKKYSFKIEILSEDTLVIPEYKIDLLNKSKKIIKTVENIDKIFSSKPNDNNDNKAKKDTKKQKKDIKKPKVKKILRTLWVRRKKRKLN